MRYCNRRASRLQRFRTARGCGPKSLAFCVLQTEFDSIPIACRVRRKRQRLPSNGPIESAPAWSVCFARTLSRRSTSDRDLTFFVRVRPICLTSERAMARPKRGTGRASGDKTKQSSLAFLISVRDNHEIDVDSSRNRAQAAHAFGRQSTCSGAHVHCPAATRSAILGRGASSTQRRA